MHIGDVSYPLIVHTAHTLQLDTFNKMVETCSLDGMGLKVTCDICRKSTPVDTTVLENGELKEQVRQLRVEIGKLKVQCISHCG